MDLPCRSDRTVDVSDVAGCIHRDVAEHQEGVDEEIPGCVHSARFGVLPRPISEEPSLYNVESLGSDHSSNDEEPKGQTTESSKEELDY